MLYRSIIQSFTFVLVFFTFAQAQVMGIRTDEEDHFFIVSRIDSITFDNPQLSVEPQELDFGEVMPERVARRNITLINSGTGMLIINRIFIENNDIFYVDTRFPIEVYSGNPHVLEVFFSPPEQAEYADDMVIHSNAPDNEETVVSLSGVGFDPFFVEETDINMSILIQEATFNGQSLEPGDLVLTFTQDELLAGVGIIPDGFPDEAMGMAAWGADPDMDNGFQVEEEIDFRFWIARLDRIVDAECEVINGVDPVFMVNGFLVVRLWAVLDEEH